MSEERTPDYEGVDEAPATPEVPEGSVEIRLEDLSVLPLEPGDIILVRLPGSVYEHDIVRAREHVKKHLPGHEVLVIPADVELAVMRPPRVEIVEPSADSLRFSALSDTAGRVPTPKPPTVEELCVNNQDYEYFRTLFSSGKAMFCGQPIPPDTPVIGLPTVPAGHVRIRSGGRDYLVALPPPPEWTE